MDILYYVFMYGMFDLWFKWIYLLKYFKKWIYWLWGDYCVLCDVWLVFFMCEEECWLVW